MKPGGQFQIKGVSEAIHCKDNKPEITQIEKEINTADLHSGKLPLCRQLGCLFGKQRQKQVWCHGEACRLGLY